MIARIWRGTATVANAPKYEKHFTSRVYPALLDTPGFEGGSLLKREAEGKVEFLVLTRWASLDAIRAFAGEDVELAVVEPEAREVLDDFDVRVNQYELVV